MADVIIIALVLIAVVFAVRHIVRARAGGDKCAGCPDSGGCSKGCGRSNE